ncbi:MAG: glycyl-radical enzyme activating protein [Lachnospiraceae bacterium]|nr:glycyl-radical enzyme activating protein [Lachnospiraceae bacterium]MBQ5360580.1 glycyl-radical enzyme activating protein [Lachnospiraceae bacterium]
MEARGIVFNIQKFSIHDGPGIRTTVFLKGCPLRCRWCSNPESQLPGVQILYHSDSCLHCGKCVQICPEKAMTAGEGGRIRIDFHKCTGCLSCVKGCPGRALTGEGEYLTAEEVTAVCLQDMDFYEESGGGVTVSGGEGMASPDFTEALVLRLRKEGIHTAIETTGCVGEDVFHRLAPLFDLLLFDVKHYDPEKHREGTGVDNVLILKNLRWAKEQGLNILPRIPVIPGFNAKLSDAEGIAALLADMGLFRVQLLPFHQMGERKYEFLNRDYEMKNLKALHPEDLTDYQKVFLDHGIDCFF